MGNYLLWTLLATLFGATCTIGFLYLRQRARLLGFITENARLASELALEKAEKEALNETSEEQRQHIAQLLSFIRPSPG